RQLRVQTELYRLQGRFLYAENLLDRRPYAREPLRVSAGAANKGRSELSTRIDSLASFVEGLTSASIDVIDLTQPLSERTPMIQLPPPFANTPNWKTHEISRYDETGPACYWHWFEGGEPAG